MLKIGFSGLKYLMGKGVKVVNKVLPKVTQKSNKIINKTEYDFIKQTSIYDPNSPDFIHRIF